jgi:hypothetical protein
MNKQTSPEEFLRHGTSERFGPGAKETPLYPIEIKWAENVAPPMPTQYLIKGIVEPRQVSIWFGPPGNGKTFFLLYLAHAIAQGRAVFGRRVRQAKTLYMALEGRGGIDKRIYALCKTMGDAPAFGYSGTAIELLTTEGSGARINEKHLDSLTKTIQEHGLNLVIIDTMNLTLGGADENDNSVMGQLMKAAGGLAEATGAHIAFIAHSGKDPEKGVRGASAQKGNADLIVVICGEKILTASTHGSVGKVKDGADFKLHFRLQGQELLTDDDGDVMTSCTVEEAEAPEADTIKKISPNQQGWLTGLKQMFDETGSDAPVVRTPIPGLTCLTLTRDQVREGFKRKGRLGDVDADGRIKHKYSQQLSKALIDLKDRDKINMTDKLVWLIN